ncbi:hypothetical protein [Burkholderia ubonensis]|uniref:hypothetical protein n=1 Tax=Burkholderia ubonensis TaxID=101571 RepID=UPI0012F93B6A|nr:hypothetical protein [Burkholderia ubonensis]
MESKWSEYVEEAKHVMHPISAAGFAWDVGKTVFEGWESTGSFLLELANVFGWIGLLSALIPFLAVALPVSWPLYILMVGGIVLRLHVVLVLLLSLGGWWAYVTYATKNKKLFALNQRIMFAGIEFFFSKKYLIPATVIALLCSSFVHPSPDYTNLIRFVGCFMLLVTALVWASSPRTAFRRNKGVESKDPPAGGQGD